MDLPFPFLDILSSLSWSMPASRPIPLSQNRASPKDTRARTNSPNQIKQKIAKVHLTSFRMSQVPLEEVINLTWIFETLMMEVFEKIQVTSHPPLSLQIPGGSFLGVIKHINPTKLRLLPSKILKYLEQFCMY